LKITQWFYTFFVNKSWCNSSSLAHPSCCLAWWDLCWPLMVKVWLYQDLQYTRVWRRWGVNSGPRPLMRTQCCQMFSDSTIIKILSRLLFCRLTQRIHFTECWLLFKKFPTYSRASVSPCFT
jgi:hypothetical protein